MLRRILLPIVMLAITIFVFYLLSETDNIEAIREEPWVIAHRGANDRFNEHTLPAYRIAFKDGVDAIEIDLRVTKDGELIALHDQTLDRTTDASGNPEDYTMEEIKQYTTISGQGDKQWRAKIPTLREIVMELPETERFYIETRLVNGEAVMERKVIELLSKVNLLKSNRVVIQSFSEKSLAVTAALASEIPLTRLYRTGDFSLEEALNNRYEIIGMSSSDVTKIRVDRLHRAGKEVHVFFPGQRNQYKEQRRVRRLHVDGYFTDDIRFTKELLKGG